MPVAKQPESPRTTPPALLPDVVEPLSPRPAFAPALLPDVVEPLPPRPAFRPVLLPDVVEQLPPRPPVPPGPAPPASPCRAPENTRLVDSFRCDLFSTSSCCKKKLYVLSRTRWMPANEVMPLRLPPIFFPYETASAYPAAATVAATVALESETTTELG